MPYNFLWLPLKRPIKQSSLFLPKKDNEMNEGLFESANQIIEALFP